MMNHKIALLTLAGTLSASSLYAVAAGELSGGSSSADGTSQTREPAPKSTNADPDAGSLPKEADGRTTDSGSTPAGSKTGGGHKVGGGGGGSRGVSSGFAVSYPHG